jgi:hypothetical protein
MHPIRRQPINSATLLLLLLQTTSSVQQPHHTADVLWAMIYYLLNKGLMGLTKTTSATICFWQALPAQSASQPTRQIFC